MSFPICTCKGERGPVGPRGPQGPRGIPGAVGPSGPAGRDGIDGISCYGESVPEGVLITCGEDTYLVEHGARGPEGPVGPQGLQGSSGLQGERGFAGESGPIGPQGPRGEQGPAGNEIALDLAVIIQGRWNCLDRNGVKTGELELDDSVPLFFSGACGIFGEIEWFGEIEMRCFLSYRVLYNTFVEFTPTAQADIDCGNPQGPATDPISFFATERSPNRIVFFSGGNGAIWALSK